MANTTNFTQAMRRMKLQSKIMECLIEQSMKDETMIIIRKGQAALRKLYLPGEQWLKK